MIGVKFRPFGFHLALALVVEPAQTLMVSGPAASRGLAFLVAIALAVEMATTAGCESHDRPSDASVRDGSMSDVLESLVAAPAPPSLASCPTGWVASEGPEQCTPPEDAPCPADALQDASSECRPLGNACPASEWPSDLPTAGVHYVRSGARGNGTRAAPYGRLSDALRAARDGEVVMVGPGEYIEDLPFTVRSGVTLRGSCVAQTRVGTERHPDGGVSVLLEGGVLRDVTVMGPHIGVAVTGGGELRGVRVTEVSDAGIYLREGSLLARDVRIDSIVPGSSRIGVGIAVVQAATLTLEDSLIEATTNAALTGSGGAQLSLSNVRVRDPMATAGWDGSTVEMTGGSHLAADRLVVMRAHASGVLTSASSVDATRLWIEDTRLADGRFGRGLVALAGSRAVVRQSVFRANHDIALFAASDAVVEAEDTLITGTEVALTSQRAAAIAVADAQITLTRVRLVNNQSGGIHLLRGRAILHDVSIEETRPDPEGRAGRAVELYTGSVVEGERVALLRGYDVALIAFDPGAAVTLSDLRIAGTATQLCAATTCPGEEAGQGMAVVDGASAQLVRFDIADNDSIGVSFHGGTLAMAEGRIFGHPIGLHVGVADFDVSHLGSVMFLQNRQNIDRTARPPPPQLPLDL